MEVAAVIVEQLDADGTLRTFRMRSDSGQGLVVALADEYREVRSGPFHFLDEAHEKSFRAGFAQCQRRRLTDARFSDNDGLFDFKTSWIGIPTDRQRLSYYALCLPVHAIPLKVQFIDPRTGREFKKAIVRDDQHKRFVLYLECRSNYGFFDFELNVGFRVGRDKFSRAAFRDGTTTPYGVDVNAYERCLPPRATAVVQQFFAEEIVMGDKYNVSGQVGAVGANASSDSNTFNQIWLQGSEVDMTKLAAELAELRLAMREQASEVEHNQSVASIGAAESAARDHDSDGVIGHLKASGKWALDVATKLGVSVAAKAIEVAMGL